MTLSRCIVVVVGGVVVMACAANTRATISESWESAALENPFTGSGDLTWTGDTDAFAIVAADWPSGAGADPQDFGPNTEKAIRSSNAPNPGPSTILTDIGAEFDDGAPMKWTVYVAGNAAAISTNKRVDLILVSNTNQIAGSGGVEEPSANTLAYKLTLWDTPGNLPDDAHEDADFGDSLVLWKSTNVDNEWIVVAGIDIPAADLDLGYNLQVTRSSSGRWKVGYSNAPKGAAVGPPVINVVDTSVFLGTASHYSGMGWLTTSTDATDFGFDDFGFMIPEPGALALVCLGTLALLRRRAT